MALCVRLKLRRLKDYPVKTFLLLSASVSALVSVCCTPAEAVQFRDLFVFGDSYSDTGSFTQYSNGPTAVGYLAEELGITLDTSQNPHPGTNGVNFAQTAAKITVGPTPPKTYPLSINQQVEQFRSYVKSRSLSFNPAKTLFFLEEGLNDAQTPLSDVTVAIESQVQTLYSLGRRYFELTTLPYLTGFSASAVKFDLVYDGLIIRLQKAFPEAVFGISQFGHFYDQIVTNPVQYGFTNATDPCVIGTTICATPNTYVFYYGGHPSTAAAKLVGNALYHEALALSNRSDGCCAESCRRALPHGEG